MSPEDSALLQAFEALTLPKESFRHATHVRMAWLHLRREPAPAAIIRFCDTLRRFAAKLGVPDLYHETVTWAFLLLIHERMARTPEADSFEAFAAANPDLLTWKPSVLDRYYRPETLASELARRVFLLPDRLAG